MTIYVIIYFVSGLVIGSSAYIIEKHLESMRDHAWVDINHRLCMKEVIFYALLGVLWITVLIQNISRVIEIAIRRRQSKKICLTIRSLGLAKYDPIIITFINGESYYAGFNYIDDTLACLVWFSPGSRLSGGGWDMSTYLTRIAKVERATYTLPDVIW